MIVIPRDSYPDRTIRMSRRRALGLLGSLGGAALLAACGGTPAATPAPGPASGAGPRRGGTLRIAQVSNPRFFNPGRQLEFWGFGGIYDSLLRYGEGGKLIPHLAESYQVSPDGRSVTLKLRTGVTFHSGRAFTADDVAFTLQKLKEPGTGAPFRSFALAVTKLDTPDPQTVVMSLDKPEAGILDLLGNFYIPDKEAYADIDRKGAGTGPFAFVEFLPDERVVLKRNENYWGPKAPLDRIEVRIFGDAQAVVANLEAGQVDVATVPLQDFVRLAGGGKHQTQKIVGASIFNIWLNTKRKPFDNKLVRQALAFALDRARFNTTILLGQSQPTNNPLPADHWGFFPELDTKYAFNLERAKGLLAEAGYPNGFETTINSNSQSPEYAGMVQILQADLATIGVKLTIDAKDGPRWAEAADRGEFDINMHSYGRTNADPSLLFKGTTAWRPDANPTGFSDPHYLELIDAQSAVVDREKRKPLLKALVEYVQDQAFVIPIAGSVTPYVIGQKVQGLTLLPVGIVAYMEKVSLT